MLLSFMAFPPPPPSLLPVVNAWSYKSNGRCTLDWLIFPPPLKTGLMHRWVICVTIKPKKQTESHHTFSPPSYGASLPGSWGLQAAFINTNKHMNASHTHLQFQSTSPAPLWISPHRLMAVAPSASLWRRRHDSIGYLRVASGCAVALCRPLSLVCSYNTKHNANIN